MVSFFEPYGPLHAGRGKLLKIFDGRMLGANVWVTLVLTAATVSAVAGSAAMRPPRARQGAGVMSKAGRFR